MKIWSFVLIPSLALAGSGSIAEAQTDPVAAEVLFREAREAVKRGDLRAACPKFAESQRLDPAAGTLFNLADCEERTGKLASAWQHYIQAQGELPRGDDRATAARERAARLEKRLPRLTLRFAGDLAGARVLRDGVELGAASLGVAIPADPGEHVIVVRLASGKQTETHLRLAEGEARIVDLVLPSPSAPTDSSAAPAATAPTSPAPSGELPQSTPWAGRVLLGGGGLALVVGAITGVMVFSKKSTFESECDARKVCSQQGLDAASSGRTLGAVSTVSFAVGAALVGLGAYLVVSNGTSKTSLAPSLSPHLAGLHLEHRF